MGIKLILILGAFFCTGIFAQEASPRPAKAAEAEQALPALCDLMDGVLIQELAADSFKLLSAATAHYTKNDAAGKLKAGKVAEAKAKAAISRFLKEDVSTETISSGKTVTHRVMTEKGEVVEREVSKSVKERIRTASRQFLTGLVVLETRDIPAAETTEGDFRILIGVSSASVEAARAAGAALQ